MKFLCVFTLVLMPLLAKNNEPVQRLDETAAVFSEITAAPDSGISQELPENAHCIVIVPDLKTAAFVFAAKYGNAYLLCRYKLDHGWSAPATVRIDGGSVTCTTAGILAPDWRLSSYFRCQEKGRS